MSSKKKKKRSLQGGWKIIFSYLLEYKQEIILLSFLGIISAGANGLVPLITGRFLDAILDRSQAFVGTTIELPLWTWLLIVWAFIQIVANAVDWVIDIKRRKISTMTYAQYTTRAISRLLLMTTAFHKNRSTGGIWDKMMRAQNSLADIIERVVINLAPQFLSVLVGLAISFIIQPWLALVLVAGLLIYVISLIKIVPPIINLQRRGHKAWNEAYTQAYDAIDNIYSVKQSTSEKHEARRIRQGFIGRAAKIWFGVEKIWVNISVFQRIVVTLTQLTVFALAAAFIYTGELTIGELIALTGYASMVFGPFIQLGFNWQTIQNGLVAIERAEKLLQTPTESYEPKRAIELKKLRGAVELQNVSFSYKSGEPEVLNNINMQVKPGEIVALVGESGVGKSTLIQLISGYYFPKKGKVLIDGYDIRRLKLNQLRSQIAVVPQEVDLFNDTIKENIRYGAFKATDAEIEQAAKKAHADIFIDKFPKQYKQQVGERGVKLSVGEKQRIAIARAILRDPSILILDEPTSALDVKTEKYIKDSLNSLMAGRTTFIIAHRLSTVRNANRIFVFDDGNIVEAGTHDELIKLKKGVYRRLYELHIGFDSN